MMYSVEELLEKMKNLKSREEAQALLAECKKTDENAEDNIGYLTGYLDTQLAEQLIEWFDCPHPVFGRKFPSPENAYLMGSALGEAVKNGQDINAAIKQIKDSFDSESDHVSS